METFIRRSLGLKAHTVVKVEEREAEGGPRLIFASGSGAPATAGWPPSTSSPECCAPIWPA